MTLPFLPLVDDEKRHRTQIATTLNEVLKGRQNNVGTITLAASTASTTIADTRLKITMKVFLTPRTASAAANLGNTYIETVSDGKATLTHLSTTTADRIYDYVFHGG
jgi:hypothetical protein